MASAIRRKRSLRSEPGLAIGLTGAFGLARLLNALLSRVSAIYPATFGAAGDSRTVGVMSPARSARKVEPTEALHYK